MLLMVRHGLTPTTGREMPEPGPGPGLSEDGRKQAEEAGQHISSWRGSLAADSAPSTVRRCPARGRPLASWAKCST